jgi:nucleoside phosphorylase
VKTLVFALKAEANNLLAAEKAVLVEKYPPKGRLWECAAGHILITGVGAENVWTTMGHYLKKFQPEQLINLGAAAAIDPDFASLKGFAPRQIIDFKSGYYFLQHQRGRQNDPVLLTVPAPVMSQTERLILRKRFGNDLIDMEAAPFVYSAVAHKISWSVWKCVSDDAGSQTVSQFKSRLTKIAEIIAMKASEIWKE